MYTIVTVVYGTPLTEEIQQLINKWEEDLDCDKWYDNRDGICGFKTLYSGHDGHSSGFCGIALSQFDESDGYNDVSKTIPEVTEEQKKEALELINELDDEIKAIMKPIGLYFIWSTS